MKPLLLNGWFWLIVVAVLLAAVGGGYMWGHSAATTSCKATAGTAVEKVEKAEDKRDENIDRIAAATAGAVAAAINGNRSFTDESTERIRTVVVPGACRDVDPDILHELRTARDDVNAALGIGVRPTPSGTAPADP